MPKRRMPPTRYPYNLEKSYQRELIRLVRAWRKAVMSYFSKYLAKYLRGGTVILDADDNPLWVEQFNQQLDLMGFSLEQSLSSTKITSIATKFVRSIDTFSYSNVKLQAGIVGLDPISQNDALRAYTKAKISENVSLIQSMHTNYLDTLKNDIYRSITKGSSITDITDAIVKRTHMAENHAKLIANDQTGTIISQVDAYRTQSAGATKYIWRSMEDQRVRPKHRQLDGKIFRYNDPNGGDDGQKPGEPIRCRCVADPIFE